MTLPDDRSTAELRGWAAFAGCSAVWGSTFLVISIGNEAVPPLWAASLRLMLAIVLLTALAFATGGGLPRGAARVAAAQFGFLNFGLSFCLLYWGVKFVPSGIAAVVYGIIPLTTALFARTFGLERLNRLKVGATLVALAGVAVIFRGQLRGAVPPGPMFAIVAAAICASLSGVLLKRGPRQPPLGANAIAAMTGLAVCLPASFLVREPHALPATGAEIFPIVYLTLAGSIGAFVLFTWLVNQWKITRTSFIAVVVPVVGLALGTVLRHEKLTPVTLLGVALVFGGLALGIAADRVEG